MVVCMSKKIQAPNFTMIPNIIFDYWLARLSPAECKVLFVICRKTFGWHKDNDVISLSQIENQTGLSRQGVIKSMKILIEHELIKKTLMKNTDGGNAPNLYCVNVNSVDNIDVNSVDPSELSSPKDSEQSVPRVGNSGHSQKKPLQKKKEIKKEIYKEKIQFSYLNEEKEDTTAVRDFVNLTDKQIKELNDKYTPELIEIMLDKLDLQHEQIIQGMSQRKKCYTFSIFRKHSWLWDAATKCMTSPAVQYGSKQDFKLLVKSSFVNGKSYNHAEYNADEVHCSFVRGTRHEQLRWNDYDFKEKFNKVMRGLGISFGKPDKPKPQQQYRPNPATDLIKGLAASMRAK